MVQASIDTSMNNDQQLKEDLENYLEFINLLNKSRPDQFQKRILHSISEERNTNKRIKIIKALDAEAEKNKDPKTSTPAKDSKPDSSNTAFKNDPKETDSQDASKQDALKRSLTKYSFIKYRLEEYPKFLQFSQKTRTLEFSFFGLVKRISNKAYTKVVKLVQMAPYYIPALKFLLYQSWRDLPASVYNVVAYLYSFLLKLEKEGKLISDSYRTEPFLQFIRSLTTDYLPLIEKEEHLLYIKNVCYEILTHHQEFHEKIPRFIVLADDLLEVSQSGTSFFNIFRAAYMMEYNQFISVQALRTIQNFKPVNDQVYQFPKAISANMEDFLKGLQKKYLLAQKMLFQLKYRVADFSVQQAESTYPMDLFNRILMVNETPHLSEYYETGKHRFEHPASSPLALIEHDVIRFIVVFTQNFTYLYQDILNNKITVDMEGRSEKIVVFTADVYDQTLKIVKSIASELNQIQSGIKETLTFNLYLKEKNSKQGIDSFFQVGYRLIQQWVGYFEALFLSLTEVLFQHNQRRIESNETFEDYDMYTPIGNPFQFFGFIPFYNFRCPANHPYHPNRSIQQILEEIVWVTSHVGILMQDSRSETFLQNHAKAYQDVETYLTIKMRLGL